MAVLPPGGACLLVINRSCQMYLVTRRGPVGKLYHLNWQHKWLWAQAGSEQPGSVPKATSFLLEKLSHGEEPELHSEWLSHHTCTLSSKPELGYHWVQVVHDDLA